MRDLSMYSNRGKLSTHACWSQRSKTMIVDIAGTLCDPSGIEHLRQSDYGDFYRALCLAPPIQPLVERVRQAFRSGTKILVITARPDKWTKETRDWLDGFLSVPHDGPFCRENGDMRDSQVVKKEIFSRIAHNYDVDIAVDSNPEICDMWREMNFPHVFCSDAWSKRETVP